MFAQSPPPAHHHHVRFYIVMATLVLAMVVFVLYLNDDNNGVSLTGAITGYVSGDEGTTETTTTQLSTQETNEDSSATPYLTKEESGREVNIDLSFEEIPTVEQSKVKIKGMELRFDDLSTKINVNDDRLELNNLEEVNLRISDFSGDFSLDERGISLDGTTKILDVNGISLSSKKEISISFKDLDYSFLSIDEIELNNLELPTGNGELKVSEKLTYELEQEEVKLNYFNGRLSINELNGTGVNMLGIARGIDVSGALLDLNLR